MVMHWRTFWLRFWLAMVWRMVWYDDLLAHVLGTVSLRELDAR